LYLKRRIYLCLSIGILSTNIYQLKSKLMNDVKDLMVFVILTALFVACNDGKTSNRGSNSAATETTDSSTSPALVMGGDLCPTAEVSDLGMEVIPQDETSWCWAACGEMVIKKMNNIIVPQCDLATLTFDEREGCCVGPRQETPPRCLGGGWPDLNHYDINFDSTRNNEPLPWDTIVNQINCKKAPICVAWHRDGGGRSHMAVISAYSMEGGSRLLYILDPEFSGAEGWWTYDEYLEGPPDVVTRRPMYTHWRDLYKIAKQ